MKAGMARLLEDWWAVPALVVVLGAVAYVGLEAEVAVLAVLAAGVLALLSYRSPVSLIGWMMIAAPLITYRGPMNINPFRVFLGIALVVLALIMATRPQLFRVDAFLILGLAFLLKQCQAFAFSEHAQYAQKDLALHVWGMTAMATASFLVQFGRVRPSQLARYFLAGFTLVVALNFYEIVQRSIFHEYYVTLPFATVTGGQKQQLVPGVYRTHLPLATANHFGAYCAVSLVVLAGIIRARESAGIGTRQRLWSILLMPFLTVSFLCTFSRSALINLFVGAGFLFGGKRGGRGVGAAVVVLVLLMLGLVLALSIASVVFGFEPQTFLTRMTLRGTEKRGLEQHLRWKEIAVELWLKYPLLGAGLHEYGPYAGQDPGVSRAHSVYFTVLAESGLLGLFIFVFFLFCLYRMALRAIALEQDKGERLLLCHLTAGLVGFVASSMFYDFFVEQEWWWLYMGVLHGFCRLRLQNRLPEQTAIQGNPYQVTPYGDHLGGE